MKGVVVNLKLNRLKSVANQAIRETIASPGQYLIDPFYHYTPEKEFIIDLIKGIEQEEDDVDKYYNAISDWFHEVLPKEFIPIDIIDKAIINITPEGKECIIEAKGRIFTAKIYFKTKS